MEIAMSKPKSQIPKPAESTDERLDEALEETFPASDPIAVDPEKTKEDQDPAREKKRD
jgi:hypothetical protein